MEPTRTVDYDGLPDAVLVRMSRDGDERAYRSLVTRHHRWVIGVAYSVLWDSRVDAWQDAQDVAQSAFAKAYSGLARGLRVPDSFRAYMYRVTRNAAVDYRKSPRTWTKLDMVPDLPDEDSLLGDPEAPQEQFARQEDVRALLRDGLARLSPDLREAILMRFGPGELSFKEMARSLGIGVDGAEKRVQRAVGALRRHFERTGAGALMQDARFTTILAVSVGVGFTEKTMASVNALPAPSHGARFAPGWRPHAAGGMAAAATLVVGLTGLSGGAPEPADPVAGAEHDVQPVAFVDATGPVDRAPPVRPYSPEKRVLDPGSGADAWVAGDPTLDGTPPVAQTTHPHGRYTSLMTLNRGSIRRDFEPVTGVVSVTMWVRPPMGSTPIRIGMLIDGTADPLNGLGVYIEKDDADQWSYPRQSVPASGVAPAAQRDRERERVASYENRVYALELVQDTRRGSFDVWLDGARVARDVARPWTQGLPVTGVYIGGGKARTREGQALYFGDVTATARRWDGPATATEVRWAAAPPIAVAWGERPLHVLEEQLTTALATRDVAGARVVADRMSARFGGSPEAADAERRVTEGEIEVAGMQPAATEGRDRVRSAVNALGRDKRARTTDDAFAEWARANASVTHAQWDAWLEDRLGGKHVYVGFLPEHYVDRTHLFHMACEVVRAYHFMNADYTGSIGVEVRNPAGGERSLVGANSWDLGDEFHRRHAPGGEPPTPFYPVTRFVLGRGGEVYANQTSALLRSADGGVNWRREDTAAQRVEAFCEDDGVVYGRQYGAGALLARGPAGIWGPVNPTPAAALVAAGFLGELSTPDIDPRVGHSAEADGRRDVTGVTWSDGAAYALSDGVVTLRDAVYPIRAWRVVVTPNNVNIVGAEAAFRARYTDSIVDRDWLWDNDRIREAELATADPPPGLDWLDVVAAPDGWVDLEAQLRPTAPNGLTTGYMVCYIDSPDARRLALNTMRTGALGIWVNGQRIPDAWHVGDESRDNTVSVPVRPGRNALMIKMGRLGSQWGVQARFLPEGMDGVRVASVADAQGVLPAPVARDVWLHMNHMLASRVVPALHVSDGRLCAATDDGVWVFAPDDFRWARSARGVEEGADFVYALTTHGGAVYSARKSGVFRLDPDTDVWEARGAGMDDHHVRSIVSAHGVLLAGTHQGRIYLSADDGRNWTRVHGHEPAARL